MLDKAIVENDKGTNSTEKEKNAIDLLLCRAMVSNVQADYAGAAKFYDKVLQLDQTNPNALNDYAWILSEDLNQPEKALDLINKAIQYHGKNPSMLDTRGVVLIRLKKYDKALEDLLASARSVPRGTAYFHLGRLYDAIGKPKEAQESLEQMKNLGIVRDQLLADELAEFDRLSKKIAN